MKRLCIFDFDGTLFDSICDVIICFNRVLKHHGFPTPTYDEYVERLGGNIDEVVSLILKENNSPQNIELVKDSFNECYRNSDKHHSVPFDGIMEMLGQLQERNITLAINSNRHVDFMGGFIDKYFSDIEFLRIESHHSGQPSKPHPQGVNNIITQAGVSPDEVIYIGDSKTDIRTAQNAGIDCVIVRWGYGSDLEYENDYILATVDSPSEIIGYFDIG